MAAKWDRKLVNRTLQKEYKQKARDKVKTRLQAPPLLSGCTVTGSNKDRYRIGKKRKQISMQDQQPYTLYWTTHGGLFTVLTPKSTRPVHKGSMCPSGLATLHPAGDLLLDYAMKGCPANTGQP